MIEIERQLNKKQGMRIHTLLFMTAVLLCLLMGRMFAVTAHAAGTATLDEATGVLTISGEVVKEDVQAYANDERVKYVMAQKAVLPSDCEGLFKNFKCVQVMNLESIDTSNVTNMKEMFSNCEKLSSVSLNSFCTSNVKNMYAMFSHCETLYSLDLRKFDTAQVNDMAYMFSNCKRLSDLNLESFDTSKVTKMSYMFAECDALISLNLGSFSTKASPLVKGMFQGCDNLTTIYVSDLWNLTSSYDSSFMFTDCVKLVGGNGTKYNSSNTDGTYARIDVDGKPGYFTFGTACCDFQGTTGTLTLRGSVDTSYADKSFLASFLKVYADRSIVKKIVAQEGTVLPADCTDLFSGFSAAVEIDLHLADTSSVTNMFRMFEGCSNCKIFDLTGWDTSKVTNMSSMFYQCAALTNKYTDGSELRGIQEWNTDSVTKLSYMFAESGIKVLRLGTNRYENDPLDYAWKTDQVTDYTSMFSNCDKLEILQIMNFTLKSGAKVDAMLSGCTALKQLYFYRDFCVTKAMNLDNTYGWTDYLCNGYRISGTDECAVIPVRTDRISFCENLKIYEEIKLSEKFMFHVAAMVNDRPYVGNTTKSYVGFYRDSLYEYLQDYSGWYDVERDCFMSKTDTFQPDKGYVFRVRLQHAEGRYYFSVPTAEELKEMRIEDLNDPSSRNYLEVMAAHMNEDGTLDIYASLAYSDSYEEKSVYIAQSSKYAVPYYLPKGTVYKYSGFEDAGGIYAYRLPKMYTKAEITDSSIMLYKLGGSIMSANYQKYMGIDGYEVSIDGVNYEDISHYNGLPFSGLSPATDYTISVRVMGESEPFWSEKFTTESVKYTVSFDGNGAEGSIADILAEENEVVTLPDYTGFVRPSNMMFDSWNVDGISKQPGEQITVTKNVAVKAVWKEMVEDSNLKFAGAALTLEDNLAIKFTVNASVLTSCGVTDPYVIFDFNNNLITVRDYIYDNESKKYGFVLHNIAPQQINDTVTATLYAKKGNTIVKGHSRNYSVADYCVGMMKNSTDENHGEFETLLVDLMYYGEAAQVMMNYKTDDLMTDRLTETQKAWRSTKDLDLHNCFNAACEKVTSPSVKWKGAGLFLEETVAIRYRFMADDYDGITIKVTDENGHEWIYDMNSPEVKVADVGGYYLYFNGLNAGQMRDKVYAVIYRGTEKVSHTVLYSVESYVYSNQGSEGALLNLINSMMRYGDSAKAFAEN